MPNFVHGDFSLTTSDRPSPFIDRSLLVSLNYTAAAPRVAAWQCHGLGRQERSGADVAIDGRIVLIQSKSIDVTLESDLGSILVVSRDGCHSLSKTQ